MHEPMVEQFPAQAPLAIKKQRGLEGSLGNRGQKGPLMQVSMNNVGIEQFGNSQSLVEKQDIQVRLVPGGAGREFTVPGDIRDADDGDFADIATQVVADDDNIMTNVFKRLGLLVDPHMTPPV